MKIVSRMRSRRIARDESGYVLVMAIFVLVILSLIGVSLVIVGINEYNITARTKLMDQAYAIADAGVNRAAVHLQLNPTLTQTTTPGPYPTPQAGPFTESFGGGQFTYTIYQSEVYPTDPTMKVIRSKGTITLGGKTSERTIETRIRIGFASEQYDAMFDYLFFVYNKDYYNGVPGATNTWPYNPLSNPDFHYFAGNYTFDGYEPYNNRYPKGAIYCRGNVQIPVAIFGDVIYRGNVVATDNVTLKSTWGANWDDPGVQIGLPGDSVDRSKVIAGLDGSGSVSAEVAYSFSAQCPTMSVYGKLVASDDVTVNVTTNASLNAPLYVGEIRAGKNVTLTGSYNISKSLSIGPIVSGQKTNIVTSSGAGVSVGNIWAGQAGDGYGVDLFASAFSPLTCGDIKSLGDIRARLATTDILGGGSSLTTGSIDCNKNILIVGQGDTRGFNDNIVINGIVRAKGWVKIRGYDDVKVGLGTSDKPNAVTTEKWAEIGTIYADVSLGVLEIKGNVLAGSETNPNTGYSIYICQPLWDDANVYGNIQAPGPIYHLSTQTGLTGGDDHISGGIWGSYVRIERNYGEVYHDLYIGTIPNTNDSIRSTGNVYCHGAGDLFDDDIHLNNDSGEIWGSSVDLDDTGHGAIHGAYGTLPSAPDLGKLASNPVYVDRDGKFDKNANGDAEDDDTKNVDVLAEAGLSSTVQFLEPNWQYFETCATQDDHAHNPPAHMIYDTGNPAQGDYDGVAGNGEILFRWDSSTYSSNETVYNGDPDVDVIIQKVNWTSNGFTGTLVSKGDVYIQSSDTDWFMASNAVLNVASGGDIVQRNTGYALVENQNCHYHFYASHNIDMRNMRLSLAGGFTYYGSFAAGNTVLFADNCFWPDCTFRWSRWALDPIAWAPPFEIYTWKEI